jgi:hypothetical protein
VHGLGFNDFELLIKGDAKETQQVSNSLLESVKYQKMFKQAHRVELTHTTPKDPKFQYFGTCLADLDLSLPVLDKISMNMLMLQNYTLSLTHCKALKQAFRFLEGKVDKILFDNCGLKDEEFSLIL